jgi:hypothetical protein
MGQEIVYCFKCHNRLKGSEFEKGAAFRIGEKTCCATCAVGLLSSLPPEEQEAILKRVHPPDETKAEEEPAPAEPPRVASATESSKRISAFRPGGPSIPKTTIRSETPSGNRTLLIVGCAAGGLILLIGLLALAGKSGRPSVSARPGSAEELPEPDRSAPPTPRANAESPTTPPVTPPPARTAALDMAREFARANPADLEGQIRLYEDARWEVEGTPLAADVKRELESLAGRRRERMSRELQEIDARIRPLREREEYRAALDALELEKKKYNNGEWSSAIQQRAAEVRSVADGLFKGLKERALDARRRGDPAEPGTIRDRVARWGLQELTAELDRALQETATAPVNKSTPVISAAPKPEEEAAAYRKLWEQAMEAAGRREHSLAIETLQGGTRSLQDSSRLSEAMSDIEALRLVSAVYAEGCAALSEIPDGKNVSLKYVDETGARKSISGAVVRAGAMRLEVRKGRSTVVVEHSDLEAETLAGFYRGRPGRQPKTDGKPCAYFLLVEGEPAAAKSALGEPPSAIPDKYWDYAARAAEARSRAPRPDPEAAKTERQARELFYSAERELADMATRSSAAEKFKSLLNNFGETRFVKRNRELITRKSQADRDYFFTASDLKGAGSFKLVKDPKFGLSWTSDADSSQWAGNQVDIEFYAAPGVDYHLYLHFGGCCTEVFSYFMQGSELVGQKDGQNVSLEPGQNMARGHSLRGDRLPATHGAHGGRKEPSIWAWTGVALPRYASPGMKKVRILTQQMGFSVGYAMVTAVRQRPPTAEEIKQILKER